MPRDEAQARRVEGMLDNIMRRAATSWDHIDTALSCNYDYDAEASARKARKGRDAIREMIPKMLGHVKQETLF